VNRVTRTGVVEVGINHFSTSERKEFAALISFSFKLVPVGRPRLLHPHE
jgi:hypothetical protein